MGKIIFFVYNIDRNELLISMNLATFITPPPQVKGPNKDNGYTLKIELNETDASEVAKLLLVSPGTTLSWEVKIND